MKNQDTGKLASKTIPIIEYSFKICYLLHLLMAFNAYFAGEKIMNVTLVIVTVLGLILGCYRLINIKKYIDFPNIIILCLFLISYAVTAVINIHYGLFESAQYFIWMLFQFGLLYAFDWRMDKAKAKKEIFCLAVVLVAVLSIYNLLSIDMLLRSFFEFHTAADGQVHLIGLAEWGRLYGVHADPNYAAVECGVAIIFAAYYVISSKKIWQKIIWFLTIIIQFFYIVYSASRSGLMSFAVGIAVFLGLYAWQKAKNGKLLTSLLAGGITIIVVMFSSQLLQTGYNTYVEYQNEVMIKNGDPMKPTQPPKTTVNREQELQSDVSNRRFDIWGSAIEIFKENPIFGVGFRNILSYAKENIPNTYILTNDYAVFDAMHNLFFDLAASQGIVGLLLFGAFILTTIVFVIKNIKCISQENWVINALMLSCCLTIGISSMFLSHILYVNNPTTYLFWACLGFLVYFIKKDKEEYRMRALTDEK